MILLQPNAPWKDSYETTAQAITKAVAQELPLFSGERGRERTAALLVSLAWFESRFNKNAVGDHGAAHGLYQQHDHGTLEDPFEASVVAIQQMRASSRICKSRPIEEMLGWYAAGGNDCNRGLRESRHRVLKAFWLFKNHPPGE
jgi:hypothetical protein